jgi:hypothetical protein
MCCLEVIHIEASGEPAAKKVVATMMPNSEVCARVSPDQVAPIHEIAERF